MVGMYQHNFLYLRACNECFYMKKIIFLFATIFIGLNAMSQQFRLISQNYQGIAIGHELLRKPFEYVDINGQQYINFGKTHKVLSMEKDAPALPLYSTSVQLPTKGSTSIVVEYDQVTEIQNVLVAPSKGNLKRNVDPADVPYGFGPAYSANAFYPANVAQLNEPFVWRTVRGQTITLSPYQYNPVTKVLRIHENLRVRVVYQDAVKGLNEISVSTTDKVMQKAQSRFFINAVTEKYTTVEESGEMLVVTDPQFSSTIEPFVNWKNVKGIYTTVVTTAETGTADASIKTYIQSYYNAHPNLTYVLLVGDHEQIPAHTYGFSGWEELWSDSYYGQLAGGPYDFFPEVFVGRFSGDAAQIKKMVDRTVEYESSPAPGNWMEKAIGLASNEGQGIGDEDEADWQHMRNIRARLMDYGYTTVYEFYDGTHNGEDAAGNPNSALITSAVNTGVGLFNYTGHGDVNVCVSGNFGSTHINTATNNGAYPFVISVACNNGSFVGQSCISETWLRADHNDSPSGAIAATGSSILMSWAQPMQTQDEMTEIIAQAYPDNIKTTTGGLFYNSQMSMLEQYPGIDGREVMQTWVFFGDPSLQFRNRQTMPLTIEPIAGVPLGTNSLTVNSSVEGALIAVSQDHVLLGKAYITGGTATITFDALTTDLPLAVIGTKQNYATASVPVQVAGGGLGIEELQSTLEIFPNPASEQLTVRGLNSEVESAELFTLAGQSAAIHVKNENGVLKADVSGLAAGSYLMRIVTSNGITIKRIEIVR